jgi:putative transposase
MKADPSKLCCPSCSEPMRFAQSIFRPIGLPKVQTFECRKCGLAILWVLTVVDTWSRVCPVMRVCRSATAMEVIDALEQARRQHGLPTTIRVDQGSQFTSKELDLWAYANGITLDFSRPGKPTDNAYVESFNATVRLECLGRHWFLDLDDAREKVEEWRTEYNEVRPHSAIGDRTPSSLIHRPQHEAEVANRPEILS